jgi:hypothetical protein
MQGPLFHHKKLVMLAIVGCAVLALAAFAFAREYYDRQAVLAPIDPDSQSVSNLPATPRISWSEPSTTVTLSPGQSLTKNLSITSNENLPGASIEAVPEIARFLAIQPTGIQSIAANLPVSLAFSIPSQTPLGTYEGTVHVRANNATVPQTLKVKINVRLQTFTEPSLGFKISYPVGWIVSESEEGAELSTVSFISPTKSRPEYGGDITAIFWPNPSHLSPNEFFDGIPGPDLFSETIGGTENLFVKGKPAVWLKGVTVITNMDILIIDAGSSLIEFQISGDEEIFEMMLMDLDFQ